MPERVLAIDDSATILKVVQLVLSKAGYAVSVASDGEDGLRLADEVRPDLILLDFVMPKLNGYQVCRALADSEALREVPVVLMSAKGEEVGQRFVKVTGIVDFITKPFSPDTLTEVVGRALARRRIQRNRETAPMEITPAGRMGDVSSATIDDESDEVTGSRRVPDGEVDTGVHTVAREAERAAALATLRQAITHIAAADDLLGDEVAERLGRGLPDERLVELVAPLAALLGDPDEVLAGDLARVPIAEVLSLVEAQRHTGVLAVRRGEASVAVCWRSGKIEFADAVGLDPSLQLGNFLLEREAMSRHDLELFFRSRGASSKLSGEQLVKLNYISREDLRAALARQTTERVYEILRWKEGRFSLRATSALGPRAVDAALGLSVETMLVQGLRRIDEWHVIEREIDDPETVFLRVDEAVARLGAGALGREEQVVLDLVNGKSSVRDIVRQSRMGNFEVSQLLCRLASIRLIRRRLPPTVA